MRKSTMHRRAIIVLWVLTIALLLLGACQSATQKIAASSETVRSHSVLMADATKENRDLATASRGRFDGIGEEARSDTPDIARIEEEAKAGSAEQDKIIDNSNLVIDSHHEIVEEVAEIAKALTGVQDITPWWAKMITYGLVALSVIGISFLLWYTGIGGFLRGVLGLVTPRARKEAEIAAAAMDTDDPTTMREFVAAKRGLDPEFDRAFRKVWKQHREAAAEQPPVSQPAASETTETT